MSLSERVFHAVPFFHYDVVYLQAREDYLETACGILDQALHILQTDPEATFTIEAPYLLQEWMKRRPETWKPLRELSAAGRLDVAPGMFVMPDMAIPSGESLLSQVEAGFRFCMETLGLRPSVCWIPDPWNHPPTLPQWLKLCGFSAYVFSRGADRGHPVHFRWRGLDGTETLAVRMPFHYDFFPPTIAAAPDAEERLTDVLERYDASHPPGHPLLIPIGGDFTAPTPETGKLLSVMRARGVRIAFSTLPRFVTALREHWSRLPVIPDDFSPTFQGTFSSRIGLKLANRRIESTVDLLRRYEAAGGRPGPWREALPVALRHQFHDTICGTIIDAGADEAAADYEAVTQALRAAAGRRPISGPRYVFNPSAEEQTEPVFLPGWTAEGVRANGQPVPVQRVDSGVLARVTVPALSTVGIESGEAAALNVPAVEASASALDNELVRLDLDERGNIRQITLRNGRSETALLAGARPLFNTLALEHDNGDFWVMHRQPLDGAYIGRTPYIDPPAFAKNPVYPWVNAAGCFSDTSCKEVAVLESGPLRGRVRITGTLALQRWRVDFEQTITLHAGSPRIEFRTVLRPSAKHVRVRALFRPTLGQTAVRYHVPFGVAERKVSEHAAQNGVSLHGSQAGMMLLNRGIPGNGWDGEILSLSLLRCVAMEYKGPSDGGYEAGRELACDYAVIPFHESAQPDLCREGDRFNLPLSEAAAEAPGAPFAWRAPENVQVTRVERTDAGWRVHGHESRGRNAVAVLEAPGMGITPADALGEPTGEPVRDRLELRLRPFEIFLLGIAPEMRQG